MWKHRSHKPCTRRDCVGRGAHECGLLQGPQYCISHPFKWLRGGERTRDWQRQCDDGATLSASSASWRLFQLTHWPAPLPKPVGIFDAWWECGFSSQTTPPWMSTTSAFGGIWEICGINSRILQNGRIIQSPAWVIIICCVRKTHWKNSCFCRTLGCRESAPLNQRCLGSGFVILFLLSNRTDLRHITIL